MEERQDQRLNFLSPRILAAGITLCVVMGIFLYLHSFISPSNQKKQILAASTVIKPSPTAIPTPSPTPTETPTPTPVPTATPTPTLAPTTDPTRDAVWDSLAQCESGGNWAEDTGNGYYGGLQFNQSAWASVGGSGNPANASRVEQISRGKMLQNMRGWSPWSECSHKLGLN